METWNGEWHPERVAVIGLGRFGTSVAHALHELGYDVTAIDISEKRVAEVSNYVALAAQGDGTDEELLRSLHIDRADVAVVAQGQDLEASVLTTLILKRLKVPWVVAKARTELHGELLNRIGADRVIYPESEAGNRLAHSLAVLHITDYITLTETSGVAKLTAPEHFVGRSIGDLTSGRYHNLNLLLIKRGRTIITIPHFDERVQAGDELVLVGADREITAFMDPGRAQASKKKADQQPKQQQPQQPQRAEQAQPPEPQQQPAEQQQQRQPQPQQQRDA